TGVTTGTSAVDVDDSDNFVVRNVYFVDVDTAAVDANAVDGLLITGCYAPAGVSLLTEASSQNTAIIGSLGDEGAGGFAIYVAAADASEDAKRSAHYVCDGIADDVEINAAIQAIPKNANGNYAGRVCLSAGNFYLADTIHLYRDNGAKACLYTLQGEGMSSTILWLQAGANCDMIDAVIPDGSHTTVGFMQIRDMTLDGNYNNNTSGNGIYVIDSSGAGAGSLYDANIDHVMAYHCAEDGFHFENSWGYKITNCITESCNQTGLYLTGSQAYVSNHFTAYNGLAAVYQGASDSAFVNIHCYKNNGYNFDGFLYGSFYIKSSYSTYSNISMSGWGDDGRGHTQTGSVGLYLYSGNGNTFASIRINGLLAAGATQATNGDAIYLGTAQSNTFSSVTIKYQHNEPIDVSPSSYGNVFSAVTASWGGNNNEKYDNDRQNNILDDVIMVQDVDTNTTVIQTEGMASMTTQGGPIAATLGDGVAEGQKIRLYMNSRGGGNNAVITITSHSEGDNRTATFDAVGEYAVFQWDASNEYWTTVAATATIAGP
ncbi:MAG TPA: hypothetical protein PLY61_17695, partial [Anaerohalosphaeraceae bacterium]|nr:hypothetical protein [Anaerohalosphaeraceae bacterium]